MLKNWALFWAYKSVSNNCSEYSNERKLFACILSSKKWNEVLFDCNLVLFYKVNFFLVQQEIFASDCLWDCWFPKLVIAFKWLVKCWIEIVQGKIRNIKREKWKISLKHILFAIAQTRWQCVQKILISTWYGRRLLDKVNTGIGALIKSWFSFKGRRWFWIKYKLFKKILCFVFAMHGTK